MQAFTGCTAVNKFHLIQKATVSCTTAFRYPQEIEGEFQQLGMLFRNNVHSTHIPFRTTRVSGEKVTLLWSWASNGKAILEAIENQGRRLRPCLIHV